MNCRRILIDSVGEGGLHPEDDRELHEAEAVDDNARVAAGSPRPFALVRLVDAIVPPVGGPLQYVLVQNLERGAVIYGTAALLLTAEDPVGTFLFTPGDWVSASKVTLWCLDDGALQRPPY